MKANLDINTRTIETLQANDALHKEYIDQLKKSNKELRVRIMALEATNKLLRQALNRDTTSVIKEPTLGIE